MGGRVFNLSAGMQGLTLLAVDGGSQQHPEGVSDNLAVWSNADPGSQQQRGLRNKASCL